MSKKSKVESKEEKDEELMTITTPIKTQEEKKFIDQALKKESVFNSIPKPKEIVTNDLEEVSIIKSIGSNIPVPQKNMQEDKTYFFELTYSNNGQEAVAYTNVPPIINTNGTIELINAFGFHLFHEIVLQRKEVKIKCRKPLEEQDFMISFTTGCFIKAISEEPWMNKNYEQTKELFDKAVLQAFRIASEELKNEGMLEKAQQVPVHQKTVSKQSADTIVVPGNIKPERPPGTFLQDF